MTRRRSTTPSPPSLTRPHRPAGIAGFAVVAVVALLVLAAGGLLSAGCEDELVLPECGNGVVEGPEECDDGNLVSGDGCDDSCLLETRELCDNGIDDDGDGSADCADPDCMSHPLCQGQEICTNGFDDDGDDLIDCDDPDCADSPVCRKAEVCDNGVDDDGNGLVDCDDPRCGGHAACGGCDPDLSMGPVSPGETRSVVVDTAESSGLPAVSCSEGTRAYHVRFEVAVGFHLRVSASPLLGELVLGLVKEEEPGQSCETDELLCVRVDDDPTRVERTSLPPGTYRLVVAAGAPATTGQLQLAFSLLPATQEICDNGTDDDGDGLADCDDPDCAGEPGCLVEICDSGVDDDGDGLVDCDDPDCATATPCLPPEECTNGLDDDGDGRIDCADLDCAGTSSCLGSDCVVNVDLGVLSRGASVTGAFDTELARDDNLPSCGGEGPDVVMGLELAARSNVVFSLEQQGDHVLAVTGEAGPGTWCEAAEILCVDPGGSGRSSRTTLVGMPAARYFIIVAAVTDDRTGMGTVQVEVHDPLVEICDDGVDDDGDGLTDCDDPDCADSPLCLPESRCHDGVDNDQDGWTDCEDFDCVGTAACGPGACLPGRHLGVLDTGRSVMISLDTTGADDRYTTPCARSGGGGDLVVGLTLASGGTLEINAQQPGFSDHVVALACQAGPGSACDQAIHACTDAGAPGLQIATEIPGVPAGEYFLVVEPYGPGGEGAMDLEVTLQPAP